MLIFQGVIETHHLVCFVAAPKASTSPDVFFGYLPTNKDVSKMVGSKFPPRKANLAEDAWKKEKQILSQIGGFSWWFTMAENRKSPLNKSK